MRTANASTRSLLSLFSLFTLAIAGAATGCDPVDEDLGAVTLRPFICTWCGYSGGNSANINGADLSNIHLRESFGDGMVLGPLSSGLNMNLRLGVDPQTDSFIGLAGDDVLLSGADMVGAKIAVILNNGQYIWLTISAIDSQIASWSDSGGMITAYRATYFNQGNEQSLCPSTNPENQWFTLIPDEVYTPEVTPSPRSVTIACVGEAAAKMKLMDFHPQGARGASVGDRQATLRMITADYCGTGESFTLTGTAVAWRDNLDRVKPPYGEEVLEALWDEDGAICLDTPRVVARDTVAAACPIPACEGDESFRAGAVWRTMTAAKSDG